jgi:hypothetical protein
MSKWIDNANLIWCLANHEESCGFACNSYGCHSGGEVVLIERGYEKSPHRNVYDVRCLDHLNEGKDPIECKILKDVVEKCKNCGEEAEVQGYCQECFDSLVKAQRPDLYY